MLRGGKNLNVDQIRSRQDTCALRQTIAIRSKDNDSNDYGRPGSEGADQAIGCLSVPFTHGQETGGETVNGS